MSSRCVGAPWVVLSREGGCCGPRAPACVSLPCVHEREVTQNPPHKRLSRACIPKRLKIIVERWQIPSFVPGTVDHMRERHAGGTDVWRVHSYLSWGRGADAYGARNACGVRTSRRGKALKKSRALVVNNRPASSVAWALITTSARSISRSVSKAEGGVHRPKAISETHVPWQATSPGTEQRDATPPFDVTRDNVCSMERSWCHRAQRPCRLSPPAA